MTERTRTWLITGVSSGLGRALAEAVLARGERVIGTLRRPEQAIEFETLASGRARACLLDLNDHDRIKPAITDAIRAAGGVDVVVNNAGYGLAGAAEELSDDDIRQQMQTNFFALVAVSQAALPFMRTQQRGHFVNIGSVAGFQGMSGLSLYSASKFAVAGFSESLAAETSHLGIKVTIVEPGAFRTNWASSNAIVRSGATIDDYTPTAGALSQGLEQGHGQQANDPIKGALAIISAVDSPSPPLHLPLGADAVAYLRRKLERTISELESWETLATSTRFEHPL